MMDPNLNEALTDTAALEVDGDSEDGICFRSFFRFQRNDFHTSFGYVMVFRCLHFLDDVQFLLHHIDSIYEFFVRSIHLKPVVRSG